MAQVKPIFEIVNDFPKMARKIIGKYPETFQGIEIDEVKCVAITNKNRPESKDILWSVQAVKEPIRADCPYAWYVTIWSSDWDVLSEKHRYLLVSEILQGIPRDDGDEGKVISFDSKGYKTMQRTFKGIDYLTDPDIPHIIDEEIRWITDCQF